MRAIGLGVLLAISAPCEAADDFKIIELEQDVLELERRIEELSRQVADLQRRGTAVVVPRVAPPQCPAEQPCSPPWLRAANWRRVRPGMGELEVIEILGPPTSVRGTSEAHSRTLMYALEIGSSAFLSGQVQLAGRRVTAVQEPVLR
jgi:hypothetical protein